MKRGILRLLTNDGKDQIFNFLAGVTNILADSISVGVSNESGLTALGFVVGRYPLTFVQTDRTSGRIVFKASVPAAETFEVREIGVSLGKDYYEDLVRLDNIREITWSAGTLVTTGKIGVTALSLTAASSSTGHVFDLSKFEDTATLALAFSSLTATPVIVRIGTDASNYFQYSFPSTTSAGYQTKRLVRSTATSVGAPSWSTINYIYFSGGTVTIDGLQIYDNASRTIARVVTTPTRKATGIELELEYPLLVTL